MNLFTKSETIAAIEKLGSHGYLEFENVVPVETLAAINAQIDSAKSNRLGFQHFIADDSRAVVSRLRALRQFTKIEGLAREAVKAMNAASLPPGLGDDSFFVLRCADAGSNTVSHKRHYDSHLLTILISLQTSDGVDMNGDLIIYPNHRKVPRSFVNIIQKGITKLHQLPPFAIRSKVTALDLRAERAKRILCKSGNVYVFNGLVSMHCNLNIERGERRSLLIHDYDPGLAFGLSDRLRAARQKTSIPGPRPAA